VNPRSYVAVTNALSRLRERLAHKPGQINIDDEVICDVERDSLNREVERS